ncbi:hypothetical protein [Neptuniibacter pectenicola]|jgi:hypothetical protein|uniref:hypothetical protein n=1 Tax=Neptuniibacter pectenicola TaxID=1806669 RepID=UPI0030EDE5EB|tara:strand:+ start:1397 stop:1801 length:405 start_codon:yes stop_codon:yes gene_type:complete
MRIILAIGISLLATVALYLLYWLGSGIASDLGYPQRGGVGWGIAVFVASFFMLPSALMAMLLVSQWRYSRVVAVALSFLVFLLFSTLFMGNQFSGGWAHPYRYIYFQCCALLVLSSLVVVPLIYNAIRHGKATG